jgi:hypothetical protein
MTSGWSAAFAARPRPAADRLVESTVGREGDALRALLAAVEPAALSPAAIRGALEGSLWMLTPEAFHYFLPALMAAGIEHYPALAGFVAELVGALTEPAREDVMSSLDRLAEIPIRAGLPASTLGLLRQQQLEWYDSGAPRAQYAARVVGLSAEQGAAIHAFLAAIRDAHGGDFPFDELQVAIDRHWGRYAAR